MAWNNTAVTVAGNALLQRVLIGEILTLDFAAGGSMTVDVASLMAQTDLRDRKQQFEIVGTSKVASGQKINIQILNKGLETEYTMKQIGIWAHVGEDAPVLFALLQDEKGIYIPSESDVIDFALNFYCVIDFSGRGEFSVNVEPTALVTTAVLLEKLNLKADAVHSHSEYAAVSHSHTEYAPQNAMQEIQIVNTRVTNVDADLQSTKSSLRNVNTDLQSTKSSLQAIDSKVTNMNSDLQELMPIVYNLTWSNNNLEFEEGVSIKDLNQDIKDGKDVKIRIKKPGVSGYYNGEIIPHSEDYYAIQIIDGINGMGLRVTSWINNSSTNPNGFALESIDLMDLFGDVLQQIQALEGRTPDVVYNLTWNPDQSSSASLEFDNEGQTITGLLADLNANKDVKIKIKKTGTNSYFDAEIVPKSEGCYQIQVAEVNAALIEMVIHTWRISTNEIMYEVYEISKRINQNLNYIINNSENINVLLQYVQNLEGRISALETKI